MKIFVPFADQKNTPYDTEPTMAVRNGCLPLTFGDADKIVLTKKETNVLCELLGQIEQTQERKAP